LDLNDHPLSGFSEVRSDGGISATLPISRFCDRQTTIGLGKNIAKRSHAISGALPRKLATGLTRVGCLSVEQLKGVLDAVYKFDLPQAPHLHDGRPAHDRTLHPSPLRRQEFRVHRRSRHEHSGEHPPSGVRPADATSRSTAVPAG
jgi:hypothetical protein